LAGIYIHVPFCKRICGYCDFFKSVSLSRAGDVGEAMLREIETQAAFIPDTEVSTIYFGGGTPTVFSPENLQRIIDAVEKV